MRRVVLVLMVFCCSMSAVAQDEDRSWTENIMLTVFGGPPPGMVEITLNGEFVAEFGQNPPMVTEIGDLIQEGQNELTIRLSIEQPAANPGVTRIAIAPMRDVGRSQRQSEQPLAQITLPASLQSGSECTQTIKFWAARPKERTSELKHRYWLIVDGPPVNHWLSVSLGGHVLYEANEGTMFFEITDHVAKGKNTVEYTAAPTCFGRPTDRVGDLEFFISTGEQKIDVVEMTGAPQAYFSVSPKSKKPEIRRSMAFRGR